MSFQKYATGRLRKRSSTTLPSSSINDNSNLTINLDESDRDSVIEVSPMRATSSKETNVLRACRRQSSNDPVVVYAKNVEESVKIPHFMALPEIEEDFISLSTGPIKKKKRVTRQSVSPAKPALNRNVTKAALKKLPASQHQNPMALAGTMNNTAGRKRKNLDASLECLELVSNKGSSINGNHIAPVQITPYTKRPPLKAKRRNQNSGLPSKQAPRKELPNAPPLVPLNAQPDNDDDDCIVIWDSADVLCLSHNIAPNVAKNLVTLFDNENTIPFIARYRRGLTNNMEAEQLRIVRDAYEELKLVREKAKTAINKVCASGQLTKALKKSILASKSISELEDIMVQFKTRGKGTLAERARSVGLEEPALQLLHGTVHVDLYSLVQPNTDGLKNIKEVELGLQHIIAEVVSKHEKILEFSRNGCQDELYVKSKKMKITKKSLLDEKKHEKNVHKFKEFFEYSINVKNIQPHTTMALNRGENLKILSVKIEARPTVATFFNGLCQGVFLSSGVSSAMRWNICKAAFEDAWDRLVFPAIARQTRAELTKIGEKESLDVFASNLKQILLAPPLKGATVMGMDPGFLNGCKVAIVSPSGEVKHADVIHPPLNGRDPFGPAAKKVCDMVKKFGVKVLALGDGTASAETSAWIGSLIDAKAFHPVDVSYTVVSERGASVYSCSPVAKEEFPSMDPNKISAVSIARRLQEPLAELVKVEPKHLGVGMYQHDLADSKLKFTLDEVVQECVSFVGVDVNTASLYLLQRVAGLNETKAKNILQWRNENGPFTSRQQLLEVKGIGPKAFEQCAGFIRVIPYSRAGSWTENQSQATSKTKVKIEKGSMPNLLDSTNVHPEAYSSALELMKLIGVELEDHGKTEFITSINNFLRREDVSSIAKKIKVEDEQAVSQLAEALTQGPAYDIRVKNSGPVFRRGCSKIEDVKCGENFTGSVQNVTTFGAFIDIGVGTAGLLHISKMRGTALQVGQRVEVKISTLDVQRKRIGLVFQ